MLSFDSIPAALDGVIEATAGSNLDKNFPESMRAKVLELRRSPSPVDTIAQLGEFIYARRAVEGLSDDAKDLGAALISYAAVNGWHGTRDDNRGTRIYQAFRRDLGDEAPAGGAWPEASSDPEPLRQFVEQPAP